MPAGGADIATILCFTALTTRTRVAPTMSFASAQEQGAKVEKFAAHEKTRLATEGRRGYKLRASQRNCGRPPRAHPHGTLPWPGAHAWH
jgi:hypothetical protein